MNQSIDQILMKYNSSSRLILSDLKESKQEVENTNNYLALSYFDNKEE